MQMEMLDSLSYDDVLLQPGYSEVLPGKTDVSVQLFPGVRLNAPIMSAAMDTVTEEAMAIAIALEQVARVKRWLNWVIENPFTMDIDQTVNEAWDLMSSKGISGLPVVHQGKLCGILTSRDLRFCRDYSQKIANVMTSNPIVEEGTPSITSAQAKFDKHKIEKLPVVDQAGHLTGLITVKDMEKHRNYPKAAVDPTGRLLVGAAVSPADLQKRMDLLVAAKVDFVVLDTAHGESSQVLDAVK
jgi:IMP dehydrogenase